MIRKIVLSIASPEYSFYCSCKPGAGISGTVSPAVAARYLPVADRSAIDVDEIRPRIIADPAAAQAHCRAVEVAQVAPLAAQIDGHALDVIAVARHAAAAHVHHVISRRRAISADHQERLMRVEPVAQHPDQIESARIHWPHFTGMVVAQHPVDVAYRIPDVMAVGPVHRTDPFAGMGVVERDRTWREGDGRCRCDEGNAGGGSGTNHEAAPAQQSRRVQWSIPPDNPGNR